MVKTLQEKIAKARQIKEDLEADGATVELSEANGTMTVTFQLMEPMQDVN